MVAHHNQDCILNLYLAWQTNCPQADGVAWSSNAIFILPLIHVPEIWLWCVAMFCPEGRLGAGRDCECCVRGHEKQRRRAF